MYPRRPARFLLLLLSGALITAIVLSGCQKTSATLVSPDKAAAPTAAAALATAVPTSAGPTTTSMSMPATWTPQPAAADETPTMAPTSTITPHYSSTMIAGTAVWEATICEKYPDTWQVGSAPSWRPGWCDLHSRPYTLYEYTLSYPSTWKVNLFGDLYPHVLFNTERPQPELRLYQIYSYETRSYTGALEEAPEKAVFCDPSEKCFLVVDPNEKLGQREIRTIGAKQALVLDSQDGQYFVRRYFFRILFTAYKPITNRLFMIKLYTPTQIGAVSSVEATSEQDAQYQELLEQVEHLIGTLQQDVNRR